MTDPVLLYLQADTVIGVAGLGSFLFLYLFSDWLRPVVASASFNLKCWVRGTYSLRTGVNSTPRPGDGRVPIPQVRSVELE